MNNTLPRFFVHTSLSGIGNKIKDPHRVVDRLTNEVIDEYKSKLAAHMHCKTMNIEHVGKTKHTRRQLLSWAAVERVKESK
jgi:hypothetical protein